MADHTLSYFRDKNHTPSKAPLDESFYNLTDEESAFFKSQTGINDDNELKHHILTAQTEAYEVARASGGSRNVFCDH